MDSGNLDTFRQNHVMKNIIFAVLTLMFTASLEAQIGIGTTTPQGALDITSTGSGVVVPRIGLSGKNDSTTVTNPQGGNAIAGTLIWNTATAGVAPNNVTPGFYYWSGSTWVPITGNIGREWSIDGNAITDPTTEFMGTTSNEDLRIRTNNNDRFTFSSNGRFRSHNDGNATQPIYSWNVDPNMGFYRIGADVLGVSTNGVPRFSFPNANQVHAMSLGSAALPFYSFNADPNTGIFSPTANLLGFSTNGTERLRVPNANQIHGMNLGTAALPFYSFNGSTNMGMYGPATGILGFGTGGAERMRILADGRISVNNSAPIAGDLFSVTTSGSNNYAINGYNTLASGSAIYAENSNTTNTLSAIEGVSFGNSSAAGVFGINNSTANDIRIGVKGLADGGSWNRQIGVQGSYNGLAWGFGVLGIGFGGAVPGGNADVAVVGWSGNNSNYSGYFNGNHVIANGTKSASVGTSKGNQLLYVTESPEVWFEDIGRAKLTNGAVTVKLDPLFLETVFVDDQHPLSVFVQEEGDSNGLYVIPGKDGFTVKEKNNGTSNISFTYRIMAKRLHFQNHRFGNDPMWGGGDTRKYNQYAVPPPVDHHENVRFQAEQKKNYKPTPMPEGFIDYFTYLKMTQQAAKKVEKE